MSRSQRLATVCIVAVVCSVGSVVPASAQRRNHVLLLERVARTVASAIRQAARVGGPGPTTAVKVHTTCCRRKVLTVYYQALPGEYSTDGVYELQLVTIHRVVQRVLVAQFPTKVPYAFGTKLESNPTFSLSITRGPSPSGRHWSGEVSYDDNPSAYQPPQPSTPGPRFATGFSSRHVPRE